MTVVVELDSVTPMRARVQWRPYDAVVEVRGGLYCGVLLRRADVGRVASARHAGMARSLRKAAPAAAKNNV